MTQNKCKVIAIIGPAGSGKNTILDRFIATKGTHPDIYFSLMDQSKKAFEDEFNEKYHIIIPFTTRSPRNGEKDGKDYWFLTSDEVGKRLLAGDIAQVVDFNGWLYGFFWDEFVEDKINIGIFNPRAIEVLSEYDGLDITTIYIVASDKDRLMRQLNRESFPHVPEIIRRYKADERDFDSEIIRDLPNLITIHNPNKSIMLSGFYEAYEQFQRAVERVAKTI